MKQEIWHTRQGIYEILRLEKVNRVTFPEVKLLAKILGAW